MADKKPKNNPEKKVTSKPAATSAAKTLNDPKASKDAKAAAGSALSQKPKDNPKKK